MEGGLTQELVHHLGAAHGSGSDLLRAKIAASSSAIPGGSVIGGSFSLFPHTGDIGLQVEAESAAELFAAAGRGLTAQMALPLESEARVSERLELEGDGWEDLFVHWLNELLLRSELASAWWTRFEIEELSERRLVATVAGPRRGPGHTLMREVKAASYHDLEVVIAPSRCRARVILDL